jgi:CrcB protein
MKLLWIGAGGALGSVARYLLDGWVQRLVPGSFPAGILVVNVLGSFLIGLVMMLFEARGALDSTLRLALAAGVLGGFTTYSSFNYQTLELLRQKDWLTGGLNLVATVTLCLLAGVLGLGAGRWVATN